jgi:ankyrin repeat protein
MSKSFKRKIIIVDKDFQVRFVKKFVSITLIGTIISLVIILTFYYLTYKHGGRDLTRYLIEVGIDRKVELDVRDNEGKTPFHLAVASGNINIVRLLIENGVELNVKDKKGKTPLFYAKELKLQPMIELLVESGAALE